MSQCNVALDTAYNKSMSSAAGPATFQDTTGVLLQGSGYFVPCATRCASRVCGSTSFEFLRWHLVMFWSGTYGRTFGGLPVLQQQLCQLCFCGRRFSCALCAEARYFPVSPCLRCAHRAAFKKDHVARNMIHNVLGKVTVRAPTATPDVNLVWSLGTSVAHQSTNS